MAAPPPGKKAAEQEDIPEEVLMIILSKLPPKSLIRFKSVSKSWHTTITHPDLATLFGHVAKMRDRNTFLIIGARPDVDTCAKSTSTGQMIAAKINFEMETQAGLQVSYDKQYAPLRLKFKCNELEVVGACSGVICVASCSSGEAVLWNPATGEEKWVKPGISADRVSRRYRRCIGFASVKDEKNNIVDFKLLVVQEKPHQFLFLVYSLCSNSWRSIKHPDFLNDDRVYFPSGGVYLHGVLHWLMPAPFTYFYILTFDVATESFGKITLPTEKPYCFPGSLMLVDDKYLAVVEHQINKGLYLWVMCSYGDMESWAKLDYMWPWNWMNSRRPVGFLHRIGGLLMQHCWSYNIYLCIDGEIHNVNPELSRKLQLVQYRESFVSMKKIAIEDRNSDTDICVA